MSELMFSGIARSPDTGRLVWEAIRYLAVDALRRIRRWEWINLSRAGMFWWKSWLTNIGTCWCWVVRALGLGPQKQISLIRTAKLIVRVLVFVLEAEKHYEKPCVSKKHWIREKLFHGIPTWLTCRRLIRYLIYSPISMNFFALNWCN